MSTSERDIFDFDTAVRIIKDQLQEPGKDMEIPKNVEGLLRFMSRKEEEQIELGQEVIRPLDFWALRSGIVNLPDMMVKMREFDRERWNTALFIPTEQLRNLGLRIKLGEAGLQGWGRYGVTHVQLLPPASGSWSWKDVKPEDWTNKVDSMMLSSLT